MIYNPETLNLKVSSYSENEAICLCPFHNDTKPSASFNVVSGLFFCFTCGTTHNVQSLAYALSGTIEKVNGVVKPNRLSENLWKRLLWNKLAYGNSYLAKRNVSDEMVETYEIRQFEHGVIFPIKETNGNTVGVQIRRYKQKPKYLTFGEKLPIWPLYEHNLKSEYTLIVEGVFGALNCRRFGIKSYAVMGAMIKPEIKYYLHDKYILGLFDNDQAGYKAGARLLRFIPRARIIVPGGEVDEYSNANLTEALYNREHTRYIPQLAELSGNKEDFYRFLPKG